MIELLVHLLITSGLLLFISSLVKGIEVDSWRTAVLVAIVMGVLNTLIYPIIDFIAIPFTTLTFGLFLLVIHAFMFKLSSSFIDGFKVNGFVPALYGSILLTLLDLLISIFI